MFGPKGAQGVALTPGRSIAVDKESITTARRCGWPRAARRSSLQRLVLAQDTGSDIVGTVRADYFVGTGAQAVFPGRAAQATVAVVGAVAEVEPTLTLIVWAEATGADASANVPPSAPP